MKILAILLFVGALFCFYMAAESKTKGNGRYRIIKHNSYTTYYTVEKKVLIGWEEVLDVNAYNNQRTGWPELFLTEKDAKDLIYNSLIPEETNPRPRTDKPSEEVISYHP